MPSKKTFEHKQNCSPQLEVTWVANNEQEKIKESFVVTY